LSSPTSQRFNQSFVKVLAKPAQEKNFKIFLPLFKEKIKKRQRTTDSDKKVINESNALNKNNEAIITELQDKVQWFREN